MTINENKPNKKISKVMPLATNPNTIGFVDEGKVDGTVKVVGTF